MRLDRAGKRHAGEKRLVRFLRLTLEALRNRNTERFCQRGNGSLVIEKRQLRRSRGAKPRDGRKSIAAPAYHGERLCAHRQKYGLFALDFQHLAAKGKERSLILLVRQTDALRRATACKTDGGFDRRFLARRDRTGPG